MSFESVMRGAVAAAMLTAATADLPAQAADAATTGSSAVKYDRNSHFGKRMAAMEEEIAALPADTTGTIVMVGDSITEGFFRSHVMPETLHGLKVVNQGISGDQIDRPTSGTGVTHRMELLKQAKPAVVFVMIGINDYWGGKELPAEVIPQYEKMFKMIRETVPNAHIVVESVLPTSKKNAYMNPYVDQLNARAKELAAEAGGTYLDLHPVMEDEKGELKAEFTGDGVHLNEEAYKVWLKKLQEVVPTVLK